MRLPNLTIPNGQTLSNEIEVPSLDKATFYGAAALTGVVTIQLSGDDGTTWHNGPAIAALALVTINPLLTTKVRLSSTLAEGADRIFFVNGGGPNSV